MKLIFLTTLLVIFGINTNAQNSNLKGITVHANKILYIENDEPKSRDTDQVFAVSFSDKIFTHLIFSDGSINNSQVYQIENDKTLINDGNTIYKFEALSGISGNKYFYEIKIDSDGSLLALKITQPDNIDFSIYKGYSTDLKTFKQ
ncbi:hypothetical protein SAMN05216503_3050 [Polaribacter sp. KT25b]|uniref:hypothetical protein n=1 Tax=Polaribacter sp. KT25b TaxID=1855336 RepID=UPI00087A80E9|nr:hypothetical protein [Polaribacter sp. KT25b]SDS43354.1 hypothetical protein SAMN05216503_3050 [Polaribacter sp. KT25b]